MLVRRRLLPALIALLVFTLLASQTDSATALGVKANEHFWGQPWFFVGVGMAVSATFAEPFFSRPQDAVVNAVGAVAAYFAVARDPVASLWLVFLVGSVAILVAGVVASVLPESGSGAKWIAFRLSSRLGRAVILGSAALLLITLTKAAAGLPHFEYLAVATGVLALGLSIDWYSLAAHVANRPTVALATGATGPRVLQVVGIENRSVGQRVRVTTSLGSSTGTVITKLPSRNGMQFRIALESEWTAVAQGFPAEVGIEVFEAEPPVAGVVGEGSSELSIAFEPIPETAIGDPLVMRVGDDQLLYQVATLRLAATGPANANALVPTAKANVVGWPRDGWIRGGTRLPAAHEPVYVPTDLEFDLPQGFYEVGRIKGTGLPIGIRIDSARRGHIAVLGMTGMGKTSVAERICRELGASNVVVALDTTGEYATRLNFPSFDGDLDKIGFSVLEPAGDPPEQAAKFIKECMTAGHEEYKAGAAITPRVILLEEAHGFVPEWNFSLRNQQDWVTQSTRMIMQARKFGLTFVVVSQRTAVVSKSALSQCENYIVLRTIDGTSLDYFQTLVGQDLREAVSALNRFEALCVGPAFNAETPVIVTLSPP